jgi:hypothetical protein
MSEIEKKAARRRNTAPAAIPALTALFERSIKNPSQI